MTYGKGSPTKFKGNVLRKAFALSRALQASRLGLTVHQVAEEIESCPRTAYRYLAAAQSAGLPIYKDGERWRVVR